RIRARAVSRRGAEERLRVAVKKTGSTLRIDRWYVRVGGPEDSITIAAQWHTSARSPIACGKRLAVSNLAVRRRETVAIEDVEHAPELAGVGGTDALLHLGSRSVLAVPILVFDDLVGVFALHRLEPGRWTPEEVSVSEAVAREIGLAVHVAHLLRDNERRIAQQSAFFRIAAMLGQSLS